MGHTRIHASSTVKNHFFFFFFTKFSTNTPRETCKQMMSKGIFPSSLSNLICFWTIISIIAEYAISNNWGLAWSFLGNFIFFSTEQKKKKKEKMG